MDDVCARLAGLAPDRPGKIESPERYLFGNDSSQTLGASWLLTSSIYHASAEYIYNMLNFMFNKIYGELSFIISSQICNHA